MTDAGESKWSTDHTSTFLEIYQRYDVLWDIKNPQYLSKTIRDTKLEDLKTKLTAIGIYAPTTEFLRKKIKSLKNVYRQELSKIENSRKSGAGVDEVYKPVGWVLCSRRFPT